LQRGIFKHTLVKRSIYLFSYYKYLINIFNITTLSRFEKSPIVCAGHIISQRRCRAELLQKNRCSPTNHEAQIACAHMKVLSMADHAVEKHRSLIAV
jgi:hypothetical protein